MTYLLAHDLGTSGDKATLFTHDGQLLKSAVTAYPCHYFDGNRAEQDPRDWYDAVCRSTRTLLEGIDPAEVAGVSFSGHMMGAVLLDKGGELLRPAIIWADQRAAAEQRQLSERVGDGTFYAITGNRNNPTNSIAKIMWVQDNEPCGARIAKALNSKDYIIYCLTGALGTDYSDASGTGAFDLGSFSWSREILVAAGVSPDIMPELQPSTALAGHVTSEAAQLTGLLEGTPVYRGCGDGTAASVGAGMHADGEGYCCLGSSAWVCCKSSTPLLDTRMQTFNLAGIDRGIVYPIGTMQAAGLSYNWMRDNLCGLENAEGGDVYSRINRQIAQAPPGANGVLYLPYLLGERSPWWDDRLRGAFLGLTKETAHADLLRAVMEGVCLNLRLILEVLRQRHPLRELRVIGGCAKEPLWQQILANVLDVTILQQGYPEEACSLGAAVIAGIGAGLFDGPEAIDRFVHVERTSEPDPATVTAYEPIRDRFAASYTRLVGLF